jgi:hypothetical protein
VDVGVAFFPTDVGHEVRMSRPPTSTEERLS